MLEKNSNFIIKLKNAMNENQSFWISLPCTRSFFQKEINTHFYEDCNVYVDEVNYDSVDLKEYYHEYNLNTLNYLSSLLKGLNSKDIRKLSIIQEEGSYTKNLDDLVNTVLNIDYFEFIEGIDSSEDLSMYYGIAPDNNCSQTIQEIINEEHGFFIGGGYLLCINECLPIKFSRSDIPELYCLVDNLNSKAF